MTNREVQIIEIYKKEKHYQHAGDVLGLSRQRVEQVVKKFINNDLELLYIVEHWKDRYDHSKEFCTLCKRPFSDVKYAGKGKCNACSLWARSNKKSRRIIFLPKFCLNCGLKFKTASENATWRDLRCPGDLCGACFSKTGQAKLYRHNWYIKPEVRKRRIEYSKKYMKKYYGKNKEKLSEYYKKYRQKNRERILAYQKWYNQHVRKPKLSV